MTDNEIIKAYGCCNLSHDECGGCDNCPCKTEGDCIVTSGFDLEREVFNLLNRQQAKIERLKYNFEAVLNERADHSEAIKEYKSKVENDIIILLGKSNCTDFVDCLNYRYKEMVGDAE